jgi:hypothetical protein
MGWVWVSTKNYTCMFDYDARGRITKAAPILRWAIGRDKDQLKAYLAGRNILLDWAEYKNGKQKA